VSEIPPNSGKISDSAAILDVPQGEQALAAQQPWWPPSPTVLVPLIVACALFMEMVDSTVITTSLPMIALDLHQDPIVLKLGLTAYMLSLGVFIPISGWMADRFGGRSVFQAAIGLFMVSSMCCGLARSFAFFVAVRFLQGAGGAMMVPVGRIVILRSIPREELVTALAYLATPAMLGPVVGPPLGGFITTYLSWRWIFFINIPISIVGFLLAGRFMEDFREAQVPPLDLRGFVLSALGLLMAMFGLTTITDRLMPLSVSFGCMGVGVIAILGYFVHARHTAQPLLELRILKLRTFWVGVGGGSLFRIGIGSLALLLPLLMQLGFGLNPLRSGLITCALAIGSVFMKPLAKPVLRLFGFRPVMVYNPVICAVAIALFGLFRATTPHWLIFVVLLIAGLFNSLQFTALNAIAYAEVPDVDVSQATSIFAMVQQLSLGSGVVVGAFALQASSFLQRHGRIVASDFWPAFLVLGLIVSSSAISSLKLPADAGAEMAGRQPQH
jgi:EmrB/QacA subfamily drug resistance transporter